MIDRAILKYILFVFLFSLFSVRALFHPGLPPTHDGEYHVVRFYEFHKALTSGNPYPRWASDLNFGMGAPLFNYVYPLPNYISSAFHFLGLSFIDAFKANLILATIISSVSMYYFARLYFKEIGGLVASVFYTFAPYRFLDIFIRGSVGEVWALSFFPALMWSLTKLLKEEKLKYVAFSGIFLSLLIFSHNILALMFFLFSFFYSGVLLFDASNTRSKFFKLILSYLLGLGLSFIFWAPALLEKKYVRGLDIFSLKENFPEIFQLIIPSWGSGFSGNMLSGQMSFQIGLINLLIVFLSFIFIIKLRKKAGGMIIFFFVSFIMVFFLMTKSSLPLWQNIPLLNYFQFPWRLLSLEIFLASVLSGFVWRSIVGLQIMGRLKTASLLLLLLLPVILTVSYSKPAYYHQRDDSHYTSRPNFISGTNSPGDAFNTVWASEIKSPTDSEIIKGEGTINVYENKATELEIESESKDVITVLVDRMYFPGWNLYVDGKKTDVEPGLNGRIQFDLTGGEHVVLLKLNNTNIQLASAFVTLVSILALLLLLFRSYNIIRK